MAFFKSPMMAGWKKKEEDWLAKGKQMGVAPEQVEQGTPASTSRLQRLNDEFFEGRGTIPSGATSPPPSSRIQRLNDTYLGGRGTTPPPPPSRIQRLNNTYLGGRGAMPAPAPSRMQRWNNTLMGGRGAAPASLPEPFAPSPIPGMPPVAPEIIPPSDAILPPEFNDPTAPEANMLPTGPEQTGGRVARWLSQFGQTAEDPALMDARSKLMNEVIGRARTRNLGGRFGSRLWNRMP